MGRKGEMFLIRFLLPALLLSISASACKKDYAPKNDDNPPENDDNVPENDGLVPENDPYARENDDYPFEDDGYRNVNPDWHGAVRGMRLQVNPKTGSYQMQSGPGIQLQSNSDGDVQLMGSPGQVASNPEVQQFEIPQIPQVDANNLGGFLEEVQRLLQNANVPTMVDENQN